MRLAKSPKSRHLSIRPSEVIEAKYSLSKRQSDLVDMVLQQVQDDDNVKFKVDMKKYCEIVGIKYEDDSREFKAIAESFSEDTGFYLGEGYIYFTSWFASIAYIGNNIIEIELSAKLKEIILNCKRAIFYKPDIPIGLKSKHTPRIYYFLKLYEDTGFRIDKIKTLQRMLECEDYNYYDFKRYVIDPAKNEINNSETSDIKFDYEPIKVGRSVEAMKFKITKVRETKDKPPELIDDEDKTITQAIQLLKVADIKLAKKTLNRIRNTYNDDLFLRAINIMISNNEVEKIKTPTKYLNAILENLLNKGKIVKNNEGQVQLKFNNFESKEYDYDTLEDALLYGLEEGQSAEELLRDLRNKVNDVE